MKKKWIASCVAAGSVLACMGALGYLYARNAIELGRFRPMGTGMINPDISVICDDFTNAFVLGKDGDFLLVDAGKDAGKIRAGFGKLGIDPARVAAILLTHTDYDHVAALELFPAAKVYISAQEEDMINGRVHRKSIISNSLKRAHEILQDGGETRIRNWTVKTIVVPGHTPGSAFYLIDGKYLFAGDSLSIADGKASRSSDWFNMDSAEQVKNLHKISDLPGVELLLTAHYGMAECASTGLGPFTPERMLPE